MRKYKIKVKVTFIGDFFVKAQTSAEAREIVNLYAFVMRGEIGAGTENVFEENDSSGIYNWDWPNHSDSKEIIKISKP